MKQFGTILKFELKYYFRNRIFVGITVFLVILIAAVMCFPRISGVFEKDDEKTSADAVMLIKAESLERAAVIKESFAAVFPGYDVRATEEQLDVIKRKIVSEKVECAFVITEPASYTYYVNNLIMYDTIMRSQRKRFGIFIVWMR